jgi:hypothetical protein
VNGLFARMTETPSTDIRVSEGRKFLPLQEIRIRHIVDTRSYVTRFKPLPVIALRDGCSLALSKARASCALARGGGVGAERWRGAKRGKTRSVELVVGALFVVRSWHPAPAVLLQDAQICPVRRIDLCEKQQRVLSVGKP